MLIFILGTAGSGKTTLAINFYKWLNEKAKKACFINLDPGNLNLEIKPEVDVREWVRSEEVMKKFNLGPNYAIIKSMELIEKRIEVICKRIEKCEAEFKIVDTPGQIELFLYRDVGQKILKKIASKERSVILFLIDVNDLEDEKFVSIVAWNAIVMLRLAENVVTLINKIDLLESKEIEILKKKILKKEFFENLKRKEDYRSLIAESLEKFFDFTSLSQRPIFISALKQKNFEEIENVIKEICCVCGDLT
jgi:GTPase SAR1 family protein